ncbi:MAG: transporter [Thioalkalivibrio sp.]
MTRSVQSFLLCTALGVSAHVLAQDQPVGVPPQAQEPEIPHLPAIGEVRGVLTPRGDLVVEPWLQFSNSQVNRFTFLGVEILDTFLIGLLEAQDVDRDVLGLGLDLRYGLTDRLEIAAKLPWISRRDERSATIPQVGDDVTISQKLSGDGLGDVELSLHYQLNRGSGPNGPFYVGNLRYKSTTGEGPFDIAYNDAGVEQEVPTGSGFHALETSITMLYVSDPAVLFGNLGYLYNLPEDVDRNIGSTDEVILIGRVEPGDAIRTSLGMSVALNPRMSMSLGYKHDFISPTRTEINGAGFKSSSLDVGSLLLGVSHGITPRTSVQVNLEVGVTADAPDVTLTLRVPMGISRGK